MDKTYTLQLNEIELSLKITFWCSNISSYFVAICVSLESFEYFSISYLKKGMLCISVFLILFNSFNTISLETYIN